MASASRPKITASALALASLHPAFLGLGLVDAVASALDCVASWPHCFVGNIALCSDFRVSSVYRPTSELDMDWIHPWIGLDWIL